VRPFLIFCIFFLPTHSHAGQVNDDSLVNQIPVGSKIILRKKITVQNCPSTQIEMSGDQPHCYDSQSKSAWHLQSSCEMTTDADMIDQNATPGSQAILSDKNELTVPPATCSVISVVNDGDDRTTLNLFGCGIKWITCHRGNVLSELFGVPAISIGTFKKNLTDNFFVNTTDTDSTSSKVNGSATGVIRNQNNNDQNDSDHTGTHAAGKAI
jgi:hypothetical protein